MLLELAPEVIKAGIERDRLLANRIIWELGEAMKKSPRPRATPDG